jgi:hypothetical protein
MGIIFSLQPLMYKMSSFSLSKHFTKYSLQARRQWVLSFLCNHSCTKCRLFLFLNTSLNILFRHGDNGYYLFFATTGLKLDHTDPNLGTRICFCNLQLANASADQLTIALLFNSTQSLLFAR